MPCRNGDTLVLWKHCKHIDPGRGGGEEPVAYQSMGEFEQMVLLAVLQLEGDVYGVPVVEEIERRTGRSVSRSAVYVTLRRLEQKGLISSWMSDPMPERVASRVAWSGCGLRGCVCYVSPAARWTACGRGSTTCSRTSGELARAPAASNALLPKRRRRKGSSSVRGAAAKEYEGVEPRGALGEGTPRRSAEAGAASMRGRAPGGGEVGGPAVELRPRSRSRRAPTDRTRTLTRARARRGRTRATDR